MYLHQLKWHENKIFWIRHCFPSYSLKDRFAWSLRTCLTHFSLVLTTNLCRPALQLCPPACPLPFTSSSVCPPPCLPHCDAFLISAYPLTLSTPSHHLSVSRPITFLLKPVSQFALSPFHPHRPSSPCLLVFNFVSDDFRRVDLYSLAPFPPSSIPIILAITPSISVGPLTLSPLPPCMCIILPVPLHSITAYLLNLSPIHLFPPQPSPSSFSASLSPRTSSFDMPSLFVCSFP